VLYIITGLFLFVDLEKHANGKLVLNSYFSYARGSADFLVIKVKKKRKYREKKVVLEII